MTQATDRAVALAAINFRLSQLGDDELQVVREFCKRILRGQMVFGGLTKNKKDWSKEAYEEFLDAAVYSAAGFIYANKKAEVCKEEGKVSKKANRGKSVRTGV